MLISKIPNKKASEPKVLHIDKERTIQIRMIYMYMYVVNILSNQINCLSGVVTNPHTEFVVILIIFSPEILNMQKRRYNAFLLCVIPPLEKAL